jgi:hypothetical protein
MAAAHYESLRRWRRPAGRRRDPVSTPRCPCCPCLRSRMLTRSNGSASRGCGLCSRRSRIPHRRRCAGSPGRLRKLSVHHARGDGAPRRLAGGSSRPRIVRPRPTRPRSAGSPLRSPACGHPRRSRRERDPRPVESGSWPGSSPRSIRVACSPRAPRLESGSSQCRRHPQRFRGSFRFPATVADLVGEPLHHLRLLGLGEGAQLSDQLAECHTPTESSTRHSLTPAHRPEGEAKRTEGIASRGQVGSARQRCVWHWCRERRRARRTPRTRGVEDADLRCRCQRSVAVGDPVASGDGLAPRPPPTGPPLEGRTHSRSPTGDRTPVPSSPR